MNTFTVVYLVIIGLLVLIFLLKKQLQKFMVIFAQGLFVVSLLGAIVGAVSIRPFTYLAERALTQGGTLETIRKIDEAIPLSRVINPLTDAIDTIKELWKPSDSQDITPSPQSTDVGVLEASVYPSLVGITAGTYRNATLMLSLVGLVVSIYLNYSVSGMSELEQLKKKYAALEKRMDERL